MASTHGEFIYTFAIVIGFDPFREREKKKNGKGRKEERKQMRKNYKL